MPVSDPTGSTVVELSRAEQWVVHHVLLEYLGLADGEPNSPREPTDLPGRSLAVLEKIESGQFEFTPDELDLLRRTCGAHARTTGATADRNLASAVADRIDAATADRAIQSD